MINMEDISAIIYWSIGGIMIVHTMVNPIVGGFYMGFILLYSVFLTFIGE